MFDCTNQELAKARLELLKEFHPDKGGSTKAFQVIEKAYQVLSNPTERKRYNGIVGLSTVTEKNKNDPARKSLIKKAVFFVILFITVPFYGVKAMYGITKPNYVEENDPKLMK